MISIDISCPSGAQQQTCHSGMQRSIDGTYIDRRTPYRYIDAAVVLSSVRYCDVLPTDCVTEVTDLYDWTSCRGRHHCVHSLTHDLTDHHHRQLQQQQCGGTAADHLTSTPQLVYIQVSTSSSSSLPVSSLLTHWVNNLSLAEKLWSEIKV